MLIRKGVPTSHPNCYQLLILLMPRYPLFLNSQGCQLLVAQLVLTQLMLLLWNSASILLAALWLEYHPI